MRPLILLIIDEPLNNLIIDQIIKDARPFRALLESGQRARPYAANGDGKC